jgi:hypothetical protein
MADAVRDELRAKLRHADECLARLADDRDKERARAVEAEGDLSSLCRELATACGGPGKPRAGETRVAYWLRRAGTLLAAYEREIERTDRRARTWKALAKRYWSLSLPPVIRKVPQEVLEMLRDRVRHYEQERATMLAAAKAAAVRAADVRRAALEEAAGLLDSLHADTGNDLWSSASSAIRTLLDPPPSAGKDEPQGGGER